MKLLSKYLFFGLGLLSYGWPSNVTVAQEKARIKAIWVVRDILKSKIEIDRMLAFCDQNGITDVFLQVRGRGDAYYNSDFVVKAEGLDPAFDPLQYVIEKNKFKKIKIHLWLNVFYVWSSEKNPVNPDHLFYTQPDWAAVNAQGHSMSFEGTKKLIAKRLEGVFISPAIQEFQNYFSSVVKELISKYPVDGIHFDYIRYPEADYDYSPSMRSRLILEYHWDPLAEALNAWQDSIWARFRKGIIKDYVARLYTQIKKADSSLAVSAAVWASQDDAQNRVLQDWPEWIKSNCLDFAVPMNYATDNGEFEKRIRDAVIKLGASDIQKIIMGVSLYNQPVKSAEEKLRICRKYGFAGVSFFSYETLRTQKEYKTLVKNFNH